MRIGVVGASGRMGRQVIAQVVHSADLTLGAAVTHEASASLGQDVGPLAGLPPVGLTFSADLAALGQVEVVIDFALPAGLPERINVYYQLGCPVVCCVTGLDAQVKEQLRALGQQQPIVYAANTSIGINLLQQLVAQAARSYGLSADIEIQEAHHTRKQDAPSGTALLLGQSAARARGQELAEVQALDRNSRPHEAGSIGFATLRAGDIVGEHTVYLVTDHERLELTHRVSQRATFAAGALRAARWLKGQPPGYYTMNEVLGLDV